MASDETPIVWVAIEEVKRRERLAVMEALVRLADKVEDWSHTSAWVRSYERGSPTKVDIYHLSPEEVEDRIRFLEAGLIEWLEDGKDDPCSDPGYSDPGCYSEGAFNRMYGHCALACKKCKRGYVQVVRRPTVPCNAMGFTATCPDCQDTRRVSVPLVDLVDVEKARSRALAAAAAFHRGELENGDGYDDPTPKPLPPGGLKEVFSMVLKPGAAEEYAKGEWRMGEKIVFVDPDDQAHHAEMAKDKGNVSLPGRDEDDMGGISVEIVTRSREEKERGRTTPHDKLWGEILAGNTCDCGAKSTGETHSRWCATRGGE